MNFTERLLEVTVELDEVEAVVVERFADDAGALGDRRADRLLGQEELGAYEDGGALLN